MYKRVMNTFWIRELDFMKVVISWKLSISTFIFIYERCMCGCVSVGVEVSVRKVSIMLNLLCEDTDNYRV